MHKARIVFDRKNMVNEENLEKISKRVNKHQEYTVIYQNWRNLGTAKAKKGQTQLEAWSQFIGKKGIQGWERFKGITSKLENNYNPIHS